MTEKHRPVLLAETVSALVKVEGSNGTFVDATFGRGGHSVEILQHLGPEAKLLAIDQDLAAVEAAHRLAGSDPRVLVCHGRFGSLRGSLQSAGIDAVDGVLMDLGVSSPQLDDPGRGFSFSSDGPLDMRMDQSVQQTAASWVNEAAEADISRVLREYAEERYARRIAAAIVRQRPLHTTSDLVAAVRAGQPRGTPGKHDATRTFQAVRMHVNDELGELRRGLDAAFESLLPGGRMVVISFHSLEDRLVKRFCKSLTSSQALPRRIPVRGQGGSARALSVSGPLRAGEQERAANPRSRSAVLRAVERVA